MHTVDIIILVLLLIGTYRGFTTGLLMQLLGIIAFILAIIGGFQLMNLGAIYLEEHVDGYNEVLPFIAFIVIFFLVIISIHFLGKALKSLIDMTLLGGLDNVAGAFTGFLKWALFISLIVWIVETFGVFPMDAYYEETAVLPLVAGLAPFLLDTFSSVIPFLQEFSQDPGLPQA